MSPRTLFATCLLPPVAPVCPTLLLTSLAVHGPRHRCYPSLFHPNDIRKPATMPRRQSAAAPASGVQPACRASCRRGGILIDGTQARWASISPCSSFDEALGECTYGLKEAFGAHRAARGPKLGNVLLDVVIKRGGLLTRVALGVSSRVHWMHPVDGSDYLTDPKFLTSSKKALF